MSEIDDMRKAISESLQQQTDAQERINQAIDQVARDRKDRRERSGLPE